MSFAQGNRLNHSDGQIRICDLLSMSPVLYEGYPIKNETFFIV